MNFQDENQFEKDPLVDRNSALSPNGQKLEDIAKVQVEAQEKQSHPLVDELKNLIEQYLFQHTHISLNGLSKRCGVATSTLRRILLLETKHEPNPSTVLAIVSAIKKEKRIQTLIDLFEGEIRQSLSRSYAFVSQYAYRPELSEVLGHREAYIIYKLAANSAGTTKEELIGLLGHPVEEKIDELLGLGLIFYEEKEGRLHAKEKNFILPEEISKKHIPELLRFTYYGSQFVEKTIFKNLSESINQETYEKVWKLQKETNEKICSLINDKDNWGEIPFFFTCIVDTMDIPKKELTDKQSDLLFESRVESVTIEESESKSKPSTASVH